MTKLLVIAGEASGDLHGGQVVKRLKSLMPELELYGTGGVQLKEAGTQLLYRAEDMAVIGFKEVARRYSYYKEIFNHLVQTLDQEKPDAVLLVDYAGFNLRFAKEAKKRQISVIFYIAPQVWAWKKGRIKTMKKVIDHLLVLFPFEVEFFARNGMEAHCFGHPLLDIVKPTVDRKGFCEALGLDPKKKLVALLPGSRRNEVDKHLPLLLSMAETLKSLVPEAQFVYPLAPTVPLETVQKRLEAAAVKVFVTSSDTYNAVAAADFAVVASGTATLETALLETPMLIFYKVSATSYVIGKYLLRIKAIGLPNIVLGSPEVPECVQNKSEPAVMAQQVATFLEDSLLYETQKKQLKQLRGKLGLEGAYQKTAQFIAQLLGG